MKKSIFAVAALGAFASAAQAQSTVTLYGTLDSSLAYLTSIANYSTTNGSTTTAGAPLAATSASQTYTTGNSLSFIDSSFATSNWGMRGSEDLGGGMQANFNVESDLLTNNGNIHTSAGGTNLFRRAANVSIKDPTLGEVFLGRRGNAYVIASANMLPVSGNTAHQWRSVTNSSIGDQVANSVSWQMPTVMNTAVLVQYGLNNTTDGGDDGTVFSSNFVNKSIENLTISGVYNNMTAAGNLAGTTSTTLAAAQGNFKSAANTGTTNQEGYAIGLRYKINNQWDVGTLYAHGRKNNGGSSGAVVTGATAALSTSSISTGLTAVGVGYQATPNLLLGANYAQTTFQAKMTNLQAHYFLSKRTRIYSQITLTQAAKGNAQGATFGAAANSFSPIASNSNTATLSNASLSTTAGAGNIPVNSNAYSLGVIHSF